MKLAFAGTPEFARVALQRLHEQGHEIALVLTQPDRPAGRGMKLQTSPVKRYAAEQGMAVCQPRGLKLDGKYPQDAAEARAAIAAAGADAMVVAAYGLILPGWVLGAFKHGCLNIHASLLPRWRGAAPIHRAIEAGDARAGVTIMQMDEGLDTGAMLLVDSLPVEPTDSTATLHDKLAAQGAQLIVQALAQLEEGRLSARAQPSEGVSYAHKIEKHEAAIDWKQSAAQIERRIRAFDPFPGASTRLGAETIKIWRAEQVDRGGAFDAVPGQLLSVAEAGIEVQTGGGVLRLTQLQRAGGRRLPVADFLRGCELQAGQVFDVPSVAG